MKMLPLFAIAAILGFIAPRPAFAADESAPSCHASAPACHAAPDNAAATASSVPAASAAKTDDYPLTTCVISGEPLGSMGKPFIYTYKQKGQPDQAVQLCCKMCVGKFTKDPAPALAKIAAAREARAKAAAQ